MKLKVSVIIPTYNSAKTIERALQSVFSQTYPPHEIIVVDDGSSDNTVEILANYKDKIFIVCQENSGAASARNQGVLNSSGDLLAFLDSDDLWHPQKLEIQSSFFEADENLGISSTGFFLINEKYFDQTPTTSQLPNEVRSNEIGFDKIFLHPFLATPTVIIRKSVFLAQDGFNESLITAEDVDLWLRSCFKNKYIFIENELAWVVTQENSLTARAAYSPFLAHLDVIDAFCSKNRDFEKNNQRIIKSAKSIIFTCIGSSLLYQHKKVEAREKLIAAINLKVSIRNLYLFLKTFI